MEKEEIMSRPAIGSMAQLGDLFDASSDSFLDVSILKSRPPPSCISSNDSHTTNIQFINTDSYADKVSGYNLNAGLTLKLLTGQLGNVEGSGSFLQKEVTTTKVTRTTLLYSLTTKVEKLELFNDKLEGFISEKALAAISDEEGGIRATHVVVRVDWGAKIVLTAEDRSEGAKGSSNNNLQLQSKLNEIFSYAADANVNMKMTKSLEIDESLKKLSVQLYGDILPSSGGGHCSGWEDVQELIKSFPTLLQKANEGKGKPVGYGLIPISLLQGHCKLPMSIKRWRQIDSNVVSSLVITFDKIQNLKDELAEFMKEIQVHGYCLMDEEMRRCDQVQEEFSEANMKLKSMLRSALEEVQKGHAQPEIFHKLKSQFSIRTCPAFKEADHFVRNKGGQVGHKISLAKTLVSNGVRFLSRGESIETSTLGHGGSVKTYILYVGKEVPRIEPPKLLTENLRFFIQLIKSCSQSPVDKPDFLFVDCDIHELTFSEIPAYVAVYYYRQGSLESSDLLKDCRDIPITGRFDLKSNGNYGQFLTAIGIGGIKWYAIMGSYSTVTIVEDNGRYDLNIVTTVGSVAANFKLNEQFGEMTADGYDATSMVTREGNSLVHVQNLNIRGEKKERITIRTFTKTEMVVNMTANNVTATRVYKRVV